MLSGFDQVNKVTEDVHGLELKLEEVLAQRRKRRMEWVQNKDKGDKRDVKFGNIEGMERKWKDVWGAGYRMIDQVHAPSRTSVLSSHSFTPSTLCKHPALKSIYPRTRCSFSESELEPFNPPVSCANLTTDVTKPTSRVCGLEAADCSSFGSFPRRRAWLSASSHSADVAQRVSLTLGEACLDIARPRSEAGIRRPASERVPSKRTAWISEGSEADRDET